MKTRELVELSAAQRAALIATAGPIVAKLEKVDRVVGYVRRNPYVSAAAVGAVALLGPQRIFALGARAITLYMLFRRSNS